MLPFMFNTTVNAILLQTISNIRTLFSDKVSDIAYFTEGIVFGLRL